MVSTFHGLSMAGSALAAQRRAIEVAGHNVANANTVGYSRQRVDLAALTGGSSMIHTGPATYGSGVTVLDTTRIVDQFLVSRANTERATLGQTAEMQRTWSRIESAFNEPGESGLAAQMEAYWDAWDAVASTPEDLAARSALLQRGMAIADTFGQITRSFDVMTADLLQRAEALTVEINGIASQIASLNEAIAGAAQAGASPNDLMDQRDELVRQLSTAVGVTTRTDESGHLNVSVGGTALVSGTRTNQLSLDTSTPGAAVLRVSNSTVPLSTVGGQVGAMLESVNVTVPAQQAALDAVAVQLRDQINAQHGLGQDLQDPPVAAGDFFVGTGARDLALAPDLVGSPERVGAALLGAGRYDGGNALALAGMAGSSSGAAAAYRSMLAEIGVNAQSASRQHQLQADLTMRVDQQREAVSGVSIDEEMANLVGFQQAYQAAARFMTTIDEMLTTLINRTGLVGR